MVGKSFIGINIKSIAAVVSKIQTMLYSVHITKPKIKIIVTLFAKFLNLFMVFLRNMIIQNITLPIWHFRIFFVFVISHFCGFMCFIYIVIDNVYSFF